MDMTRLNLLNDNEQTATKKLDQMFADHQHAGRILMEQVFRVKLSRKIVQQYTQELKGNGPEFHPSTYNFRYRELMRMLNGYCDLVNNLASVSEGIEKVLGVKLSIFKQYQPGPNASEEVKRTWSETCPERQG